jgi:hypothetical protein
MNAQAPALHAVYAPSSAHRWTECTASAEAISRLGEQEEGEEAAEGTRAHDEIERVLGHLSGKLVDYSGGSIVTVDPEHDAAYGVALVIDYIRNLPPGTLWIEQRVRLTDQIWGRCDVAHWDEASATLTIVDYKNGFVDVDAVENEQLRIYAAASIATHNLPAKWVRLVVVQPNSWMPVPRVKQFVESATGLAAWAERVAAIPTGPLVFKAGETCKYCPLFGRCPASQDVLLKLNVMLANAPDAVRPDQVKMFLATKKPVADWFAALEKAATKAALSGAVAPEMMLVTGTKHRAWKSEADARAAIVGTLGVDALELPTPAQAEKLGMSKEEVAALAETPEGSPVLAFGSDKRKPWVGKSVETMFSGVAAQFKD